MLSASFSTQVTCRGIGGRREAKAEGESELDHRCNVELHSVFRRQQIAAGSILGSDLGITNIFVVMLLH